MVAANPTAANPTASPAPIIQKYDEEPVKIKKLGRLRGYRVNIQGTEYTLIPDKKSESYDGTDGMQFYTSYRTVDTHFKLRPSSEYYIVTVDKNTHPVTMILTDR